MKIHLQVTIAGMLMLSASASFAVSLQLPTDSRSDLRLTIYNQNLALVSDTRKAAIPQGASTLSYAAVSPQINAASANLYPLPDKVRVLQQRFEAASGAAELLQAAVGQTVSLHRNNPQNGQLIEQRAKIISAIDGLIFEVDGHIETDLAGRRIVYDQLPDVAYSPTLSFDIDADAAVQSPLSLRYLTQGLAWQADYILQLDPGIKQMQLRGMASLRNDSGVDFPDANISLMAGSVNQVYTAPVMRRGVSMMAANVAAAPPSPIAIADLKRYDLPGRVTLANHSSVQVQLFEAKNVPVTRRYRITPGSNYFNGANAAVQHLKIDRYIEFNNVTEQGLGFPLPAGTARVYASSENGDMSFVGEDHLNDSAEMAVVQIKTGQAFDLSAEREQLLFRPLPVEQPYRRHFEIEWQTRFFNADEAPRTIEVIEYFDGEWLLKGGPKPDRQDARSARWDILVPAKGEAVLKLKVQLKS